MSAAHKPQFVYSVVLVQALFLKLGHGTPGHRRTETVIRVYQQRFAGEHLQHPLGIFLPVGHAVDVSVLSELGSKQVNEVRLDQPSLVMPLLGPRVRKENVKA